MVERGGGADAILFDLGLSSFQVDEPERGFSYVNEGPLDMRMDPTLGGLGGRVPEHGRGRRVGEGALRVRGRAARRGAQGGAGGCKEKTARRLRRTCTRPCARRVGWKERGGNPAKRVFQAVRVAVNDELGGLAGRSQAAERLLVPGGRLVVITFHSGEDRLVKRFISEREGRCVCPPELPVCVCGARPVFRRGAVLRPSAREVGENPRSASARLRAATRTAEPPEDGG